MFKIIFRLLSFLIIIIITVLLYLSLFGIKTNKFNQLIKSQIANHDNRVDVVLDEVFIKLNFKELSLSISSQNLNIFILKEKQKIANLNLLISLDSVIKKDNKVKKIIINSNENEINSLLKFIKAYRLNVPILYLENSISKGNIIYDVVINFDKENLSKIEVNGKIINADLNILGKEQFKNINFDFNYNNKNLEITDLKLKHKNIIFNSKTIFANFNESIINIKGDIRNKININLISSLINFNLKNYISEKIFLECNSKFDLDLTRKFKLKNYKLKSKIDFDNLNINLDDIEIKNYISDYDNKIKLQNGKLSLEINNKNKIELKIESKYKLANKNTLKDISLNYKKLNSVEKYKLNIDLTNYELILNEINFQNKLDEGLYLNINATKNNKYFEIDNFKLFNNKNLFSIKNVKFDKNFKVRDFASIDAEFYNRKNFKNDISINKRNNLIKVNSNNFDISLNIEENLKNSRKNNFFDIFENLNSTLKINMKSAKIDKDYSLKNLIGEIVIRNNKIDKTNLTAKFDAKNNFLYTKDEIDGKKVTTIFSDVATPFVKKFKFIRGFEDGKLDYTSTEVNNNLSISELRIYDFKLQDMPALTKLLSLASLQGIADLATGEGIRFNEFEMFFENSKNLITINEIYALGPAISILMEGYVEKNKLVSLRGTLVPATTINKTIAKIPLLGNILVGDKVGEGVFGVSFKIKGPPNKLDTRVNPIKTLTPRFITRTLDKIKKTK